LPRQRVSDIDITVLALAIDQQLPLLSDDEPLRAFARGDIGLQQGGQPSGGIDCQPMAHGVAMDAWQARHVLAGVGLPTGQQVKHLQAGLLVALMFMLQALLEHGDLFRDRRDEVAHGVPSRQE
jgi:hypothetical protein